MIYGVYAAQKEFGQTEGVDFVYDDQPGQTLPLMAAWEAILEETPLESRHLLGSRPIPMNDKTAMPLQAADLLAWWKRSRYESQVLNKPQKPTPFTETKTDFKQIHITMGVPELQAWRDGIISQSDDMLIKEDPSRQLAKAASKWGIGVTMTRFPDENHPEHKRQVRMEKKRLRQRLLQPPND